MKRGFPRPTMKITEFFSGEYDGKWSGKTFPVPYTAEEATISSLHTGRMSECAKFKKCVACGEQVDGETVSVLLNNGKIHGESGPFHDKCATLTERMCPHIAENSKYTFSRMLWTEVKPALLKFQP